MVKSRQRHAFCSVECRIPTMPAMHHSPVRKQVPPKRETCLMPTGIGLCTLRGGHIMYVGGQRSDRLRLQLHMVQTLSTVHLSSTVDLSCRQLRDACSGIACQTCTRCLCGSIPVGRLQLSKNGRPWHCIRAFTTPRPAVQFGRYGRT